VVTQSTRRRAPALRPAGSGGRRPAGSSAPEPSTIEKEESLPRRRRLRWALFLLLPIMLIVGGYLYFDSGAYMSTDDAYVEADKVGLSTDVSGLVKAVEVKDNQHVTGTPRRTCRWISRSGARNIIASLAGTRTRVPPPRL
jgi:hypothetical protein